MIQIKKTILTLVALIAVTTGAWADGSWTSGGCDVTLVGGTLTISKSATGDGAMTDYFNSMSREWNGSTGSITSIVIENGVTHIGNYAFKNCNNASLTSVNIPNSVTSIGESAFEECTHLTSVTIPASVTSISSWAFYKCSLKTVDFADGSTLTSIGAQAFGSCSSLTSINIPASVTSIGENAFDSCSSLTSINIPASVTSIGMYAFMGCTSITDVYCYADPTALTWSVETNPELISYGYYDFKSGKATQCHVLAEHLATYQSNFSGVYVTFVGDLQPLVPAGTALTPDATRKVWTLDAMPAGNVTLEPEYYPQATVADGGVTAADADARATTDDPLVKVDATKLTGAKKLMYFVSNSGTTAPAYDAEGWTDQLPNAEGFTQQGIVYVWYYPVGIDEGVDGATATYSDGDICLQSITARIAAAPTYAVTFADDLAEPDKWTADPNTDVTKGQTVTVTYTGSKKVLGVKAEKKAAAPAAAEGHALSASVVGEIVGTDGKAYAAADKDNLPEGVTAVAMIAYVGNNGEDAPYNHGLALALTDESSSGMKWEAAKTACNTTKNTSIPVTNARWLLASKDQWGYMSSAVLSNLGLQDQGTKYYWSSTTDTSLPFLQAWAYHWSDNGWELFACSNSAASNLVRACLAF